jgi:hypothetical protein
LKVQIRGGIHLTGRATTFSMATLKEMPLSIMPLTARPDVILFNSIQPSAVMTSLVTHSTITQSIVMLSALTLNVVILNVVALILPSRPSGPILTDIKWVGRRQGDQMILEKKSPNFLKSSQNSCQDK